MSSLKEMVYSHYEGTGPGFYSENALTNFKVIQETRPLAMKALDAATQSEKALYTICDYGGADGGVSMAFITDAIELIREKVSDAQIHIIFEDLPNNDFKSLFLRMHGLLADQHGPSFIKAHNGVFISAVGTGFLDQCVPDHSVDFGISTTAMMYLRKVPCPLTGTLIHGLSSVEEEKIKWKMQAAKDWETILLHRSKELAPGGHMVISSLATMNTWPNYDESNFFKFLDSSVQKIVEEGLITNEEFNAMNMGCYLRTKEEFSAPFNDPESSVAKSGLSLEYIEMKLSKCQYREHWIMQKGKGDPKKHASMLTASIRRWLNHPLMKGLSDDRSQEEKEMVINRVFSIIESDIEQAPDDCFFNYCYSIIHLSKKK